MPGARDALCHQALQLLAELCARGALEHDSCQEFIYHLRDRARPRLRDPGECRRHCPARSEGPGPGVGAAPGPEAEERRGLEGREGGLPTSQRRGSGTSAPGPDAGTGRGPRGRLLSGGRASPGGLG